MLSTGLVATDFAKHFRLLAHGHSCGGVWVSAAAAVVAVIAAAAAVVVGGADNGAGQTVAVWGKKTAWVAETARERKIHI